jgi:flavin reductase (DIM6/NTAB) family NADH-FMN oxidoreductase RutF
MRWSKVSLISEPEERMPKQPIAVNDLVLQPYTTLSPEGVLLVCGTDVAHANPMTISWGTFGVMWGKPILMVMVRPSRHTYTLLKSAPDFTVNWMSESWTPAVRLCGSASGRDIDKFKQTGMHPVKATTVQSPVIAEAELAIECSVAYRSQVDPSLFVNMALLNCYDAKDYHGLFFGEVVAIAGTDRFRRR